MEEVEIEENEEYDFVEGKPEEWEIACDTGDDCPRIWYCADKVYLDANPKTYHYERSHCLLMYLCLVVYSLGYSTLCCMERPLCASHERTRVNKCASFFSQFRIYVVK